MKKKGIRRPPTAALVAIIAVITAIGLAVAWLTVSPIIINKKYSLSNFDAYAEVYFLDGATKITPAKTDGTIAVNITDDTASNYIGKLNVDAYYKGQGSAYMRLKMVQQWECDGKILQANTALPYYINALYSNTDSGDQNKWFDNRQDDMCLYYAARIKGTDNTSYIKKSIILSSVDNAAVFNEAKFNAIKPVSTSGSDVTLKLAFQLQVVQINRYPQFWGIDTLPWLEQATTTA